MGKFMRFWYFKHLLKCHFSNVHAQLHSVTRGLIFNLILFVFHTICIHAAIAIARLHINADSSEPLLLVDVKSSKMSCAGS